MQNPKSKICFILGRSGVGKTALCIRQIIDALNEHSDMPLMFLVPEQATYQAERAILMQGNIGGFNRLRILSFQRLAFFLNAGRTLSPACRLGCAMIVQKILCENRRHLKIFASMADSPSAAAVMADVISELQQACKTPDDIKTLRAVLAGKNPSAEMKFADIELIYRAYLSFIENRFEDPDAAMTKACGNLAEAEFVKNARLWVDGFSGFTAQEMQLLIGLIRNAQQTEISLCLDPDEINLEQPENLPFEQFGLFSETQRTYARLVEIIKKLKLTMDRPVILRQTRRFENPAIAHVERHIADIQTFKPISANGAVQIIAAHDMRYEARFAASEICRLVRQNGYRYRDIAVIASDVQAYSHYLIAAFRDNNIPFFIDRRRTVRQYPAVELISSAIAAVEGGFVLRDVLACLRCGLMPVEREDVDALENYCIAYGVEGRDWTTNEPWRFAAGDNAVYDENAIDRLRRKCVAPLIELQNALKSANLTAAGFCDAIFDFLNRLDAAQKLEKMDADASARGDMEFAYEHRQFAERFTAAMEQMVEIFAQTPLSLHDFKLLLEMIFSRITLALIPPAADEVLIGSIERSRHPDIKAAFLIGTTARQFPVPINDQTVLDDNDRKVASELDFELLTLPQREIAKRRYLTYIAVSRASQRLYVSYPLADQAGINVQPNMIIESLERLFTDVKTEYYHGYTIVSPPIHSGGSENRIPYNISQLTEAVCLELGKDGKSADDVKDKMNALLAAMRWSDGFVSAAARIDYALDYHNTAVLSQQTAECFFPPVLNFSPTRLSRFAECPFRHFAHNMLRLRPRKTYKLELFDLGSFYHEVLRKLFETMASEGKNWRTIEQDDLTGKVADIAGQMLLHNAAVRNFIRHAGHNAYIFESAVTALQSACTAFKQIACAGSLNQIAAELEFGTNSVLPGPAIRLDGGRMLMLSGKIDRVDIAEFDGKNIAFVFDYKKSRRDVSWNRMLYGLDVQLAAYLLALDGAKVNGYTNLIPAGAFLLPVEIAVLTPDKSEKFQFQYKPDGFFNEVYADLLEQITPGSWQKFYKFFVGSSGDRCGNYDKSDALRSRHFADLLDCTRDKMREFAERIIGGEIDVRPCEMAGKRPCEYCEFMPLCRFDIHINQPVPLAKQSKTKWFERNMGGA